MNSRNAGPANGESQELESGLEFAAMLQAIQEHWLGSFVLNLLGYALIVLPAALLIRRWKQSPEIRSGESSTKSLLMSQKLCIFSASVIYVESQNISVCCALRM